MGSSDTAVLRTAIDVLSFLNGLPIQTDAAIFLNNYLVNAQNQNGDTHGR